MNRREDETGEERARREELSAYEEILEQVRSQLENVSKAVDVEGLKKIIDRASEELREIETHSLEAVNRASEAMKKDLITTAEHTRPLLQDFERGAEQAFDTLHRTGNEVWSHFAANAGDTLEKWRDWSGGTFEAFFKQMAAMSDRLGDEIGAALTYKTGEVTRGGQFRCVECGASLNLKKPGHLPPCPKCAKTLFRRA